MSSVEDVMAELAEATDRVATATAGQSTAIVKAYRERKSLRSIAEVTGLSHEGVRQILLDNGVELRGRGRPARTEEP